MNVQGTSDYPRASFYSPVPPVDINQQPVNFCQAQQLADQIARLEQVYNKAVGEHNELQANIRERGLAPLDVDAKPITTPFKANSLLPYPEMLKQMDAHKDVLDSDIVKLADRNVKVRTELDNQIKVQQYIAKLDQSIPSQPEGCARLNKGNVRHHQEVNLSSINTLSNIAFYGAFLVSWENNYTLIGSFLVAKAAEYAVKTFGNAAIQAVLNFPNGNSSSYHTIRPLYSN
jgi:hypothetical protein